ncbi:MAG: hybrid sensor histidine kinase/response regulator [Deltaproteobacteria bacterium]|nr:hybrid sensor histidine kinase/response regulator [Deltaproteobacteria bacterium]
MPPETAAPTDAPPELPARVLCVDDTPTNLDVLDAVLRAAGYEVLRAPNGGDALRIARTERPDAILLDVMMPGLDGFAVCRLLKADPHTADIPVVLLTASAGNQDDVVRGLELGAADYVTKPFRRPVLLARVSAMVALRRDLQHRSARLAAAEADRLALVRTEKREALALLAAGLSHEINNPATAVLASLDTLVFTVRRLAGKPLDPEAIASLEELCKEGATSLRRIVDVVRDLSSLGDRPSPRAEPRPSLLDLGEVVSLAAGLVRQAVGEVAELTVSAAPGVYTLAVRSDVVHIVVALLRNAADAVTAAREAGGPRGTIHVDVAAEGPVARVTVEDDGVGLPAGALARLADPYFTTKATGRGRGMGLAVASQTAASLGGELRVEARDPRGVVATLSLPRRE